MPLRSGTYRLGPEEARLLVHTERGGAAAKAGHDLLIEVGSWRATLTVGEDATESSVELTADPGSLRVIEGSGGMQELSEEDSANIEQTIVDEVLQGRKIHFRSNDAEPSPAGDRIRFEGGLTIGEHTRPIGFDLAVSQDGSLRANVVIKQSEWRIKPYSALFGALKVRDQVNVVLDGHL